MQKGYKDTLDIDRQIKNVIINGSDEFVAKTVELLKKELTISKVVIGEFRFCGLDLCQKDGKIELSMEDYAKSMFIAPIPNKTRNSSKA